MPHRRSLAAALAVALVPPVLSFTAAAPSTGRAIGADVRSVQLAAAAAPRVRQRAKLAMHPQIAQPGMGPKKSTRAKSAMTAKFRPRKAGRPVKLQRRADGRWVTVQRKRQDRRGRVEFTARYKRGGDNQRYRAVTVRFDGLRKKASKPKNTDHWGLHDFKDEFRSWDATSWDDRLQGYSAKSLRKCSKAHPRASRVRRGTLQLRVLNDPNRGKCRTESHGRHAYRLNGHVGTQGNHSFLYGYAAARVRFQRQPGQHASFWLQPQDSSDGNGGAEIDVIEWFGNRKNDNRELTSFIHKNGRKHGGYIKDTGRFGRAWSKRYHVFSVEWTPNKYIFRIDGKETFRTKRAVSNTPQILILSLLSSDYELPLMEGRLPQTMRVDWVRYWGSRV